MKTMFKNISVLKLNSLDEVGKNLGEKGKYALMLIDNSDKFSEDDYKRNAQNLLDNGLASLTTWGKNAGAADNLMDIVASSSSNFERYSNVSTSSWEDESFDEALWNSVYAPTVDEEFYDSCETLLIAVVGDSKLAEKAESWVKSN